MLPGAPRAERREEADSGLALADASRAGCPERRELIDECADSCNKVDKTWLRLLSEQMFSPQSQGFATVTSLLRGSLD